MSVLDDIVAYGRPFGTQLHYGLMPSGPSRVLAADGFSMSLRAGAAVYCTPRVALPGMEPVTIEGWPEERASDYLGPYTALECGFPSERPEPWRQWERHCEQPDDPTDAVYSYVPVEQVRALFDLHGGELRLMSEREVARHMTRLVGRRSRR